MLLKAHTHTRVLKLKRTYKAHYSSIQNDLEFSTKCFQTRIFLKICFRTELANRLTPYKSRQSISLFLFRIFWPLFLDVEVEEGSSHRIYKKICDTFSRQISLQILPKYAQKRLQYLIIQLQVSTHLQVRVGNSMLIAHQDDSNNTQPYLLCMKPPANYYPRQ